MLKLQNRAALNFLDLKKYFFLRDILAQQNEFLSFAKVHCLPLETRSWNRNGAKEDGYAEDPELYYGKGFTDERRKYYAPAVFLNKDFWFWLFQQSMSGDIPDSLFPVPSNESEETVQDGIMIFIKNMVNRFTDGKKLERLEKHFPAEWRNCWMDEQAEAVRNLLGDDSSLRSFCMILSIVQLAEQNAARLTSENLNLEYPAAFPDGRRPDSASDNDFVQGESLPVKDQIAELEPGRDYRVSVFEEDILPPGEKIITVMLRVLTAPNPYLTARILTVASGNCSACGKTELRQDSFAYCTMTTSGKFIRFLPAVYRGSAGTLGRMNSRDPALYYINKNGQTTRVLSGEDASGLSSFALDPLSEAGSFLYLADGRLYTDCYEQFQDDYSVRAGLLDLKSGKYAEVSFTENGLYMLLDTSGFIHSNDFRMHGRKAVSLGKTDRISPPEYLKE